MHEKNREYNGYSNYETWNFMLWANNDEPTYNKIQALSNYLNVPISYFFEGFTEFKEEFNLENNQIDIQFLNKLIGSLSNEYRQKLLELINFNTDENKQNSIAINF